MRKSIIAGNWKMNKTQSETIILLNEMLDVKIEGDREAVVCLPFTSISAGADLLEDSLIKLGAQNVFYEDRGAYTGEISCEMLNDLGVEYVIVGHSERREILKETDEEINKKVLKLLEYNLKPILCVGETLEERESKGHFEKVKKQIEADFVNVTSDSIGDIVIAYEPIWAIGTGVSASAQDAEDMCAFIRETITEQYGKEAGETIRIQYGGSVKPETIKEIMAMPNIDGALVGGASLKTADFKALVNF